MIAAVVLAAGQSSRMGSPKMILPWGGTTVIGRVVTVLQEAGVHEICVVTGGAREQVEAALQDLEVKTVFNPSFEQDEMALSLQVGLANLSAHAQAALVVLGDQPQIQAQVVRSILHLYEAKHVSFVVPSYQMRRGHPWLIDRALWPEVMDLQSPCTLRDVLTAQPERIVYLPVDTDSILRDLDTMEDYRRERSKK